MSTATRMWFTCAAMTPGLLVLLALAPTGYLHNLGWSVLFALSFELAAHRVRRAPLATASDGSVVITAFLIGCALPPGTSIYIIAVALAGAVILAKHLYGGLGQNLFNPAMVGYAIVLVSFPSAFTHYPIPQAHGEPVFADTLFTDTTASTEPAAIDARSGATMLTEFRFRDGLTVAEFNAANRTVGTFGAAGWEWVNVGFLIGGLALLVTRIAAWRIPVAVLGSLGLLALACYDGGGSTSLGSPLFHWFSGSTMVAAFFVATDPITHPSNATGQWLYGLLVGVLIFCLRSFASYPDGIAF
ncbi:MAG: RnfABCDGE type electron transport complex subunit D, partial [Proteobacteria bacterium]|nr:RnfABCDGE type electron transport complex subunit D [Pseudomonadota bacterium]